MIKSVTKYTDTIFQLKYLNLDKVIEKTLLDVEDFKIEYNISSKNFKYVEDKIFFHNLFVNTLDLVRSSSNEDKYKPVLFLSDQYFKNENKKLPLILKQLRVLKKLLPLPLIIPLRLDIFSSEHAGLLKETNLKCHNYFCKRKIRLSEVKKYLDTKGYTTLNNSLSSIIDLKGVYY